MVKTIRSFGYAWEGIVFIFSTQPNMKIHGFAAAASVALGLWLSISKSDWLVLLLTIALVMACEAVNTALEQAVDLAEPNRHPLAKKAKDAAAGAVLLAALFAVIIGILIFGGPLLHKLAIR